MKQSLIFQRTWYWQDWYLIDTLILLLHRGLERLFCHQDGSQMAQTGWKLTCRFLSQILTSAVLIFLNSRPPLCCAAISTNQKNPRVDQEQRWWWWCTVLARSRPCGAFVPRPYPGQQQPPRRERGIHYGSRGPSAIARRPHVVSQNVPTPLSTLRLEPLLLRFPQSPYIASADQGPGENMKCAHLWVFYNKTIWGNRPNASEALSSIQATSSSTSSTISKKSSTRAKADIFCSKKKHKQVWSLKLSCVWLLKHKKHRRD